MYKLSPDKKYIYIDGRPVSIDLLYNGQQITSSVVDATEEACAKMLYGKPIGFSGSLSAREKLNRLLQQTLR